MTEGKPLDWPYECMDCGDEFTLGHALESVPDGLRLSCPNCGSEAVDEVYLWELGQQ